MKATILYDEHGRIIAISTMDDQKSTKSKFIKVGMIPGAGQRLLDVELEDDLGGLTLLEFQASHRVDIDVGAKLVKKEPLTSDP